MRSYGYERTSLISIVRFLFLLYERQLAFSLLVGLHTSLRVSIFFVKRLTPLKMNGSYIRCVYYTAFMSCLFSNSIRCAFIFSNASV